ncbi:cytochrome c5 family protein [Vibrio sp. SM6]|uniref:Cytochrome c5 family protein n=1 Tax=Vibrio agarilyticus TaxID=2726741 RepID=A0A7X8TTD2_9VIBR|nr:cytochrome c5 family protein [Vibrio agarilyticus]NLS14433.1 cytochrome c5 family protein [Vibrio agarilyticus]
MIALSVGLIIFAPLNALAAKISEEQYQAIEARIKPVGNVYLAGEEAVVVAVPTGPRDGVAVYNTYCMACHSTGVSGAPISGDSDAWAPRIAQGQAVMLEHALTGFNAMPAKGTCMDCSDDEIQAAIDHMLAGL